MKTALFLPAANFDAAGAVTAWDGIKHVNVADDFDFATQIVTLSDGAPGVFYRAAPTGVWSEAVAATAAEAVPSEVVSIVTAGSLAFPQANNLNAVAPDLTLAQDAASGWFEMWNAPGALIVIARRSRAATYQNKDHYLIDGISNGASNFSNLRLFGGALGVVASRNCLNGRISTAGVVISSQPVTEDGFLAVLRRDAATSKGALDWYSLADGTAYPGALGGQIFQSQKLPADPTGYSITIGGEKSRLDGSGTEWPGDIAAMAYVVGDVPPSVYQAIALGQPLQEALAGFTVPWVREFDGSAAGLSKPAWAAADATPAMAVLSGNLAAGSNLRRAAAASYLTVTEKEDGYVYGLAPGEVSRSVVFSGTSAGRTGNVEARIIYQATGEVLVDWASLGAVAATWSGAVTIPKCADGWVIAQFRTTDDPAKLTHALRKFGVGYKFLQLGQSQTTIYLSGAERAAFPAYPRSASFANAEAGAGQVQQMTFIGAKTSDGLSAFVDQFRAFDPATPVMVIGGAQAGTGPDQLMSDADTGRNWSDLQAKLDRWGNDITAVLMNWATQGWSAGTNTPGGTLEALIYGTGPYSGVVDHHLTQALRAGFTFGVSPATRHATGAVHGTVRAAQVDFANARGLPVGFPVSDFLIDDAGGPHQKGSALGNRVFGSRQAYLAAKCAGLAVPAQPYFTTVSRSGATLTVAVSLPNGGTLYSPAPAALRNFQVNEGGGFVSSGFTAALSGNTIVLTRASGTWAAGTVVKYLINGEDRADNDAAQELAIINGMIYESHTSDILGLGLPVAGSLQNAKWVSEWSAVAG